MAMPADYLPINVNRERLFEEEGTENQCVFYKSLSALEKIRENQPKFKYFNGRLVKLTLANPVRVFRGLKRIGMDTGFCYCSIPDSIFDETGELVNNSSSRIFLVFAELSFGLVVFDWEFRYEDANLKGYPLNWEVDFGEELWPRT